jgi:hypothetical protein
VVTRRKESSVRGVRKKGGSNTFVVPNDKLGLKNDQNGAIGS